MYYKIYNNKENAIICDVFLANITNILQKLDDMKRMRNILLIKTYQICNYAYTFDAQRI